MKIDIDDNEIYTEDDNGLIVVDGSVRIYRSN